MEGEQRFGPQVKTEQEKLRKELGIFFDTYKSEEERLNGFLLRIGIFIKEGILDKEKFTLELKECSKIVDKEEFINRTLIVLEPILEIRKKKPRLVEKLHAESFLEQGKFIKLNEVLSYGVYKDIAHIHLAPSKELLREIGKEKYLSLISDGLKKLAKIVEGNETILRITTTSPVVKDNPRRMAQFGFFIKGPISEEDRNKHWKGNSNDIYEAEMSSEELLKRYLEKQ